MGTPHLYKHHIWSQAGVDFVRSYKFWTMNIFMNAKMGKFSFAHSLHTNPFCSHVMNETHCQYALLYLKRDVISSMLQHWWPLSNFQKQKLTIEYSVQFTGQSHTENVSISTTAYLYFNILQISSYLHAAHCVLTFGNIRTNLC